MPDLARDAASLGVPLTPEQLQRFRRYTARLLEANQRMNLTALRDEASLTLRYHLDALALLPVIARAAGLTPDALREQAWRAADVGSGGGAPAIPLAIAWPQLRYTLIESIAKKARFLEAAARALDLPLTTLHVRAEDAGRDPSHREAYDLVTARAVAELPALVELTLPLVQIGGLAVYPKGLQAAEEAEAARFAMATLGGELAGVEEVSLPGEPQPRFVVTVRKVAPTPETYPRRPGVPTKRPLRRERPGRRSAETGDMAHG
ncbi:MAG TPA: 16S rRNA (guanine(527)-N(7))-methyltransferase RsmG [Caldilineae bacterium]|nr:16S rRNA (guanine(527)-N(7))-methyltransferase RsmG [Caldilineae bacterium]